MLGKAYTDKEIEDTLKSLGVQYHKASDEAALCEQVAKLLAEGKVVGWLQGRAEYGPRSLGNRSILADPRSATMQQTLNLKIKKREGFRPFAPSVREEDVKEYFDLDCASPYMLLTAPIADSIKIKLPSNYAALPMMERLNTPRSSLPAITHVDYSARVQPWEREPR
jgi:carbamoyltransferase